MQFTWDEAKRRSNLQKHRLDFADAKAVFAGLTVSIPDNRFAYDEDRFITFGLLEGEVVVIAHTERLDETRIISMRKASKHEAILYFKTFGK